ncbi:conserved hypothetical protein [Histoplasma capsulatum H143]|uniref:Uncharacterized protein n=1 Tax=Ajellomyces capsulatus (strain H143) TaxID=544712 RepID=C6H5T2_AJECH|nr:conserved hypothetical protein [Histoplasma capsulatum H143]
MSTPIPQCLSGRAVTPQRLGGGSSLLYKGAAAAVSRLGFCVRGDSYSCCCRSRSRSGSGSSGVRGMWTRVKPRASDQAHTRGRRSGYGYGSALQKRRGLCSEARMNTGVDARSASLFIRDPARVLPSDIISKLPTLPCNGDISRTIPILLVTPAFASWIVQPHSFLCESITHIFQNTPHTTSSGEEVSFVYSVAAVVDKLPLPSTTSIPPEGEGGRDELAGCEGVSLFLANSDALAAKVAHSLQRRDMSTPETEPTISYLYRQLPAKHASTAATTFAEVGVRLANTLFLNGKPRTMLASRWRYSSHPSPNPTSTTLTLDKEYNLLNCRIESATEPHTVTARLPLYPVTRPREIVTSMGNIISQLRRRKDDRSSSTTIHASAELEEALPAYLKANNLQNQRVAVWASVRPAASQAELLVASGTSVSADGDANPNSSTGGASAGSTVDPLAAINGGTRLHRVVSGGGGWGKKQGLLSLDPEYSYQTGGGAAAAGFGRGRPVPELFFEEMGSGSCPAARRGGADAGGELMAYASDEAGLGSVRFKDGRLMTDLSEIAKEGDVVQFLVASLDSPRASATVAERDEPDAFDAGRRVKRTSQVSFGVIPSSDGSWPEIGGEGTPDTGKDFGSVFPGHGDGGVLVVPSHFGALSEKGLTYSVFDAVVSDGGRRCPGPLVQGTKIDVPGSRIMVGCVDEQVAA